MIVLHRSNEAHFLFYLLYRCATMSGHVNKSFNEPSKNIVLALHKRCIGLRGCNTFCDPLHQFAELCAATMCSDNQKAILPSRTRSTFMSAFTSDKKLVASCHGDHNIHLTNINTRKVVKTLVGHERSPWCIAFHPSSNDILATGCLNGEVRVWDLHGGGSESWMCEMNQSVTIQSLSFHPIDQVLLIATGNEVHFWDWSLPKPFVSIKTGSSTERVQLVRFDSFGGHILTGILNIDEDDRNQGDDETPSSEYYGWRRTATSTNPPTRRPSSSIRQQWLRYWLSNGSPVLSVTNRSSRPSTASYNLRGRHDNRSSGTADNIGAPAHNETTSLSPVSVTIALPPDHSHNSVYQRSRDVAHAHSYSRDHQRILHARVSVNAEIQHQYNRLQLLREERRRLERRLRQLQHNPRSQRSEVPSDTSQNSSLTPATNDEAADSWGYVRTSLQSLEQDAYDDYNEITDLLVSRMRSRLLQNLSSSNVQVSVDFNNPTELPSPDPPSSPAPQEPILPPPLPTTDFGVPLFPDPAPLPRSFSATQATSNPPDDDPPHSSSLMEPIFRRRRTARISYRRRRRQDPANTIRPPTSQSPSPYYPNNSDGASTETSQEPNSGLSSLSRAQFSALERVRQRWRARHRHPSNRPPPMSPSFASWPIPDPSPSLHEKTTYRLQWWDFSKVEMPEISRNDVNVVAPECKIHNDSSVAISHDASKVASLIWSGEGYPHLVQVGVFSLEKPSLGQLLYRKSFGPSQYAVCLSLSPLGNYLAVGLKYFSYLNLGLLAGRGATAEILRIGKCGSLPDQYPVCKIHHPVMSDTPQRYASINTIAWLPSIGQGLLYGTNNGELRFCYTKRAPLPGGDSKR